MDETNRVRNQESGEFKRQFFKKSDCFLLALIPLLALLYFFQSQLFPAKSDGNRAVIYHYDQIVTTIPLDAQHSGLYHFPELPNVEFEVNKHSAIRFSHNDCSAQICVRSGFQSARGSSIVCLPKGILVRIEALSKSVDPDALDLLIG
ncbi:MAG: NusG domain II-containing protein [Eubacteriales bacterium]|nr:NusG domain II-containing protein [Eubacteriales bacterium]